MFRRVIQVKDYMHNAGIDVTKVEIINGQSCGLNIIYIDKNIKINKIHSPFGVTYLNQSTLDKYINNMKIDMGVT